MLDIKIIYESYERTSGPDGYQSILVEADGKTYEYGEGDLRFTYPPPGLPESIEVHGGRDGWLDFVDELVEQVR